eukprot:667679-Rhodomonas_salina.1
MPSAFPTHAKSELLGSGVELHGGRLRAVGQGLRIAVQVEDPPSAPDVGGSERKSQRVVLAARRAMSESYQSQDHIRVSTIS